MQFTGPDQVPNIEALQPYFSPNQTLEELSKSVNSLCEREFFKTIWENHEFFDTDYPIVYVYFEGPTGSGKSSLSKLSANAVPLSFFGKAMHSIHDETKYAEIARSTVPLSLWVEEPADIQVSENVARLFGADVVEGERQSLRVLCKGRIPDVGLQMLGFMKQRCDQSFNVNIQRGALAIGLMKERYSLQSGMSMPVGLKETLMGIRRFGNEYNPFQSGRNESTPVIINSDRSLVSSLAIQALLYSFKHGVAYEESLEGVWKIHRKLIEDRKLIMPSFITISLPTDITGEMPGSALVPEDLYALPLDSEKEVDAFEHIFDPGKRRENEYWMYAMTVETLRRLGDFPPIIVLYNDPSGARNTLTPHAALCSAIAHQCMYGEMDLTKIPLEQEKNMLRIVAEIVRDDVRLHLLSLFRTKSLERFIEAQPELEGRIENGEIVVSHNPVSWL